MSNHNSKLPPDIISMQSLEDRAVKAEMEAMRYKALYDELREDMGGFRGRPATPLSSPNKTAHNASGAILHNVTLIDRLISFIHPDKHSNCGVNIKVANELTAELLKLR